MMIGDPASVYLISIHFRCILVAFNEAGPPKKTGQQFNGSVSLDLINEYGKKIRWRWFICTNKIASFFF